MPGEITLGIEALTVGMGEPIGFLPNLYRSGFYGKALI